MYVSREQKRSNLWGLCLPVLFLILISRQHVTGGRMGLCHDITLFILYLDFNLHIISHGLKRSFLSVAFALLVLLKESEIL